MIRHGKDGSRVFGIPRGKIWMGTWRTLNPRRTLHPPNAVSVYGGFRQASREPGPSGPELRTLLTGQPLPYGWLGSTRIYILQLLCQKNLMQACTWRDRWWRLWRDMILHIHFRNRNNNTTNIITLLKYLIWPTFVTLRTFFALISAHYLPTILCLVIFFCCCCSLEKTCIPYL